MEDAGFTSLASERLRIRRFCAEDAEAFAAWRSDPRVARFQAWKAPYSLAEARKFIAGLEGLAPGTRGRWFQFAVTRAADDALLGDCGLGIDADDEHQAELGFSFARAHQGRGYAAEAVTAVVTYAFGSLGLRRIRGITDAGNAPARRLLARLGFSAWGPLEPDSTELLFRCDREDWQGEALHLEPLARSHAADLTEMARELGGEQDPWLSTLLEDPDGFFAEVERFADGRRLPPDRVPMTWFLLFAGARLLGAARLRHRLIQVLERDGGHIGFEIRPSERGRGHAKALLARTLGEARRIGLSRVLLTAAEANALSRAVIEALGGEPAGSAVSPRTGATMQRYWIELATPAGLEVRDETPADTTAVERLVAEAFGRANEAALVARLRVEAQPHISLVAERDGRLVGHVFLSPVRLEGAEAPVWAGLGPLATAPAEEGRGVGALLVRAGLEAAARLGFGAVFLAGDPRYYARFGFRSAPEAGLHYPKPAFDPAFQVVELEAGALTGHGGIVQFHPAFDEAEE